MVYDESLRGVHLVVLLNFVKILRFVWIISLQKAFKPAYAIRGRKRDRQGSFSFLL